MTAVEPISDDAGYERAQARARQLMNNWADEAELAELKALAKAVTAYARTRFDIYEDPCPVGIGEWRERLLAYRDREPTGMGRMIQDWAG